MIYDGTYAEFSDLVGQIITKVETNDYDYINFYTSKGVYTMCHYQDCCESVTIDDINGELNDLVGQVIKVAEVRTNCDNPKDEYDYSHTWTFYTIGTMNGWIDIRWYGTSNGYYSESVDIVFKPYSNED